MAEIDAVLMLNGGSTSLRHTRFAREQGKWQSQASGRIAGTPEAMAEHLPALLADLPKSAMIAHRIVHGGRHYQPALVDDALMAELQACAVLAPLHQAPALALLRACQKLRPDCSNWAVFDSLPYEHLPAEAADYALPRDLVSPWPLRRSGFHGLAHLSLRRQALSMSMAIPLPTPEPRVITLQLGGGVSLTAWRGNRAVDTSMGLTPLEGPVMASRSGDIDPGLLLALIQQGHYSAQQLSEQLYRHSGLLGLSGGKSGDPGQLLADNSAEGRHAVAVYCHRLRRYIGAFIAVLGGCDELVIGGGVGENEPALREILLSPLAGIGLQLDSTRNQAVTGLPTVNAIHAEASAIRISVAPVDESAEMLAALQDCLRQEAVGLRRSQRADFTPPQ